MVWQLANGEEMMTCQQQGMARRGVASSIMRTGRLELENEEDEL